MSVGGGRHKNNKPLRSAHAWTERRVTLGVMGWQKRFLTLKKHTQNKDFSVQIRILARFWEKFRLATNMEMIFRVKFPN
jgi:hypothetical protein